MFVFTLSVGCSGEGHVLPGGAWRYRPRRRVLGRRPSRVQRRSQEDRTRRPPCAAPPLPTHTPPLPLQEQRAWLPLPGLRISFQVHRLPALQVFRLLHSLQVFRLLHSFQVLRLRRSLQVLRLLPLQIGWLQKIKLYLGIFFLVNQRFILFLP